MMIKYEKNRFQAGPSRAYLAIMSFDSINAIDVVLFDIEYLSETFFAVAGCCTSLYESGYPLSSVYSC